MKGERRGTVVGSEDKSAPNNQKYKDLLGRKRIDEYAACGTCSVYGCNNEADHYVDFKEKEIKMMITEKGVRV